MSTEIMEALVSRLCHDLAGPASAVANGLELISEMGAEPGDEALQMVEGSIGSAIARLQFFRLAFGQAGGRSGIAMDQLRSVAQGLLAEGRATLTVEDPHASAQDEPVGLFRAVLGSVFVANDAMPRGGTIAVVFDKESVTVRATPAQGKLTVEGFSGGQFAASGNHSGPTASPRSAAVCALRLLAEGAGIALALEGDEDILSITLAAS
ncbi:MAG: histidine phosphotransferase family protein [Alphaproteobacteria bacterium]|nr:histidine phosphotransferase family protein [Alphaproteobacteria bacterium]